MVCSLGEPAIREKHTTVPKKSTAVSSRYTTDLTPPMYPHIVSDEGGGVGEQHQARAAAVRVHRVQVDRNGTAAKHQQATTHATHTTHVREWPSTKLVHTQPTQLTNDGGQATGGSAGDKAGSIYDKGGVLGRGKGSARGLGGGGARQHGERRYDKSHG